MKIKYLEEGEEIPSLEEDMPFLDTDIEWTQWISEIKVKLDNGAIMPTRGHESDAGYDLYAPKSMVTKHLWKNDSIVIDTGVHMLIPDGYCGMIISKSGLNVKHSVTTDGLIDSGYTGSIKIKMYNHGDERLKVEPGDKISQIVIVPCMTPRLILAKELPHTDRGTNGFGSTGRK